MATSLLYLGPCLGPYSILVTAGSGGVYVYSCCSCYGCCGVAGAAIGVASSAVIRTTCGAAVGIVSRISRAASGISGAVCGGSCGGFSRSSYGYCCGGCNCYKD